MLVHGPRLAGKTALLRREFPGHLYLALDQPANRAPARTDPERFLARLRGRPAIIDDLHRAPELVAHLVQHPTAGLLLASSRRLSLRCPTFELHPPTSAECERRQPLPLEMIGRFVPKYTGAAATPQPWPSSRRRFLEADLHDLISVHDPDRFEIFLEAVERRSGHVLDQQALANEAGVSHRTAVRWLAALDAGFLTLRLPPAGHDFGRRLVRSPKLHLLDSQSFESQCVSQIYRNAVHAGVEPGLRFWRDSNGFEIPLVIQAQGALPVPVGIAEVPGPGLYARMQRWMRLAGVTQGAIVGSRAATSIRGGVCSYALGQL